MFIAGGVLSTVLQTSLLQWWSMGKMLFEPQGDLQYREWPLGKIGSKTERQHRIQFLQYIHGQPVAGERRSFGS